MFIFFYLFLPNTIVAYYMIYLEGLWYYKIKDQTVILINGIASCNQSCHFKQSMTCKHIYDFSQLPKISYGFIA
jgi:hypothetical protein